MSDRHATDCEEVVANLLAYLDGEMDTETRARIDAHLEHCRGCFSRAEFERALRRRLQELRQSPPSETLSRRIRTMLDAF